MARSTEWYDMGLGERTVVLGMVVVTLTVALMLTVGELSLSVISGVIGAALPVVMIYGVIQFSTRSGSLRVVSQE